MRLLRSFFLILGGAMTASGQAAVESAIGTAGAAGASSGAAGAGKAAGGVFGSLTKVLERTATSTAKPSPSPSTTSIPAMAPVPIAAGEKAPASKPIDASVVVAGLTRARLVELCGSPTSATQKTRAGSVIETLWYNTTTGDELEVQLTDGTVTLAILASDKQRARAAN